MASHLRSDFPAAFGSGGVCPFCERHYEDRVEHDRYCKARASMTAGERRRHVTDRMKRIRQQQQQARTARIMANRKPATPGTGGGNGGKSPALRFSGQWKHFNARLRERFIARYVIRTGELPPLYYLDYRFWQALGCGFDPRRVSFRRREGNACEPDDCPGWRWWCRLSPGARLELMRQSRAAGMRGAYPNKS